MESKTLQKIVESNSQSWLLVEVRETSPKEIFLEKSILTLLWSYGGRDKMGDEHDPDFSEIVLPIGLYTLYGKGSDLTEIQKMSICAYIQKYVNESPIEGWRDYTDTFHAFQNVDESFISLLTHHQFKPNGCVILKVVK